MTYRGKTVVSYNWSANVTGIVDADKNIDILFTDNTVLVVKYSSISRQLAAQLAQQTQINNSVTETTNLKSALESQFNLS